MEQLMSGKQFVPPRTMRCNASAKDAALLPHDDYPRRARNQRLIARICKNPRLTAELLDHIGRRHHLGREIEEYLAEFAAIDDNLLTAFGGDRFALPPMREVRLG
jgi:hypothetical protein